MPGATARREMIAHQVRETVAPHQEMRAKRALDATRSSRRYHHERTRAPRSFSPSRLYICTYTALLNHNDAVDRRKGDQGRPRRTEEGDSTLEP